MYIDHLPQVDFILERIHVTVDMRDPPDLIDLCVQQSDMFVGPYWSPILWVPRRVTCPYY